eukprot:CAMPEP_0198209268 /NCGR_PEP_ID=MMETSP1445-20131203/14806_1 /TAXON_ID=36898 /ORGANISM="Pyramimonas sp., Strain CCMP2087" /LENGTH=336 /DNA_ID=CAMNT_0043882991 /DNA_START=148 /DNA_END=1158 /DNA_ORIENTATION=-
MENMENLFALGRTPSEDEFQKFLSDHGLDQQEGAEELRDLPRVASIDLLRAYFSENSPLGQPSPLPVLAAKTEPDSSAPGPSLDTNKVEPSMDLVAAEACVNWEQKVTVKKPASEPTTTRPSGTAKSTPPPSSCGSDEDDEDLSIEALKLKEKDPDKQMTKEELRRLRRMISNRESARRSRRRKVDHVHCLDTQIAQLKNENSALLERLAGMEQRCREAMMDNSMLKEEVEGCKMQLRAQGGKMNRSTSLNRVASQEHLAKRGRAFTQDYNSNLYFQNSPPPCRQIDHNMPPHMASHMAPHMGNMGMLGNMFRSMGSYENMMQLQYPHGQPPVPGN